MVATPRMREQLNHWEVELYHAEIKLSTANNPFEREHWQHMAEYSSRKILLIEKEMYKGA